MGSLLSFSVTFPTFLYSILPDHIALWLNFLFDALLSCVLLAIGRFLPSLHLVLPNSPDHLRGKTAIITGANSGIGLQIALDLSRLGATVVLACRNTSKADEALQHILRQVPSAHDRVSIRKLDTSSFWSIKAFATEWQAQTIDILVHNAGIAGTPPSASSEFNEDGYELIYATNILGSFLLTYLLESCLSDDARVIFTSSTAQYSGRISPSFSVSSIKEQLEPGFHFPATRVAHTTGVMKDSSKYSMTKSMQCAFAQLLQARFDRKANESGRTKRRIAQSFTPGFTSTPIFEKFEVKSFVNDPMFAILKATLSFATDVSEGATTGVWLASTNDKDVIGAGRGGRYWDRCTPRMCTADLMSRTTLERLWIRWEADAGIEWR